MKELYILPEVEADTTAAAKPTAPRQAFRGGAKMIVQQFKEWQRLPLPALPAAAKELQSNVPPNGMDLGNFYRL